jgi:hypothetical protein
MPQPRRRQLTHRTPPPSCPSRRPGVSSISKFSASGKLLGNAPRLAEHFGGSTNPLPRSTPSRYTPPSPSLVRHLRHLTAPYRHLPPERFPPQIGLHRLSGLRCLRRGVRDTSALPARVPRLGAAPQTSSLGGERGGHIRSPSRFTPPMRTKTSRGSGGFHRSNESLLVSTSPFLAFSFSFFSLSLTCTLIYVLLILINHHYAPVSTSFITSVPSQPHAIPFPPRLCHTV